MLDIIPDIHGQYEKLTHRLTTLGYTFRMGAWRHSENPWRRALFLGDYIDRGANNAGVIDIVRGMQDAGTGLAIMGNHELNAIYYHTADPETGKPLRKHSDANTRQHAAFLKEFPFGEEATHDTIEWMKSLPLFLEEAGVRAVHACWDDAAIASLKKYAINGVLPETRLLKAADKQDPLFKSVETTTKGPEAKLPDGYSFDDKNNSRRERVRLKWWPAESQTWRDISISVPDPAELPAGKAPEEVLRGIYDPSAPPVFFGHYWLSGAPEIQAPNALCLDFSAGKEGPLVSYLVEEIGAPIDLTRISGL